MSDKIVQYPAHITTSTLAFIGKFCLYIIEVEFLTYKFGISVHICDRLKTHYRDMRFTNITEIFDCVCNAAMTRTESNLKKFAADNGELINKYNKTEIIYTTDIDKYIAFVKNEIIHNNADGPAPHNQENTSLRSRVITGKYTCFDCGKTFADNKDLNRHKNRKTPCLIRNTTREHINNPNRCIYCNRIFSNIGNLRKHLKICKIKNGGMNILDEKVQYEQKIRLLEDKDRQKDEEIKLSRAEIKLLREDMKNQIDQIKQLISVNNPPNPTINPIVNSAVNTVNNNIINANIINNTTINFYNYDKPKVDTLKLLQDDLLTDSVTRKLIELMYFNKLIPENHVLWRPNIREYCLLVHKDGNWCNVSGESLETVLCNIKNAAYIIGHDKINGGDLHHSDDEFFKLYPAVQRAIQKFNGGDPITDGTVMEIIAENREIIKSTLNGNKII
jgi:hypothetical protein